MNRQPLSEHAMDRLISAWRRRPEARLEELVRDVEAEHGISLPITHPDCVAMGCDRHMQGHAQCRTLCAMRAVASGAPTGEPRLSDEDIAAIAERMEATDPSAAFWREFARAVEAHVAGVEASGYQVIGTDTPTESKAKD